MNFVLTDQNIVATGTQLLPNLSRTSRKGLPLPVPPIPIATTVTALHTLVTFAVAIEAVDNVAYVPREFGDLPEL